MTLPSLWQQRHPRHAPDDAHVEGSWDAVVIGAGVTGLTTALLLGRSGLRVLVLEARTVGAGTTGRSTAKLSLLQGTRLSRLASRHGPTVLGHYLDLHREGQAWISRFCADHGVALQRRPAYTFATTEEGEQHERAELATARECGLPVEWVSRPPLPFETRGAVRLADQAQLDPVELLEALLAEAEAGGVTLVEGVRVRQLHGRSPARLETSAGTVRADHVVLATNMPFLDRGGFFARAKPSRSYALAFRDSPHEVDGMYLSADSPRISVRDAPGPDGPLLLVGGHGHPTGRSAPTSRHLDRLRRWTEEHYPGAVEVAAWSAQDFEPHHGLPYVGPLLPGRDDVLVSGGYAKWGITGGAGAAVALSARVLGGQVPWAEALEPWSRHEISGTPTAARINAEVGVELARGWIRPLRRKGQEGWICTHLGGIVTWNDAEDSWDCPLHGSRFDADGEVLEGPATCGLRRRTPI